MSSSPWSSRCEDSSRYVDGTLRTAELPLENTFDGDHFSFIGCRGWYEHGKALAAFDLDAASTLMMLQAAYDVTGDSKFLGLQRTAFDWFRGTNDLRIPLCDFRTKGCADGLMPGGVNGNQGTESMVSFLLSLLTVLDSYAIMQGPQVRKDLAWRHTSGYDPFAGGAGVPTTTDRQDAGQSKIGEPL